MPILRLQVKNMSAMSPIWVGLFGVDIVVMEERLKVGTQLVYCAQIGSSGELPDLEKALHVCWSNKLANLWRKYPMTHVNRLNKYSVLNWAILLSLDYIIRVDTSTSQLDTR